VLRVGVTGGIGSGKSTVTAAIREALEAAGLTVVVVDADAIARQVVEPGAPALAAIVERFGPEVVDADGRLDRARLADLVFGDDQARAALTAVTHPAISAEMMRQVQATPADGVCLLDVPLLVEDRSRAERGYHVVVVVEAPPEVRVERLVERGMRREDAAARMGAQASDEERRALADHVVDNGGGRDELARAVAALVPAILAAHRAALAS
jgi:dephospho-CoA kinase